MNAISVVSSENLSGFDKNVATLWLRPGRLFGVAVSARNRRDSVWDCARGSAVLYPKGLFSALLRTVDKVDVASCA